MSNGAKWWKFDFHTHTPASNDYGKGPNREELKKLDPAAWLKTFMEHGIDCVAITDHNSGLWIDVLKDTLKRMETENAEGFQPLYLFPGVEISVHGGIHLLALFGNDTKSEDITRLLGMVGYQGRYGETEECTNKPYTEVVEIIQRMNGIAIPAHVDKDSGLFTACQGNTLKQNLKTPGILAMQLCDLEFEKPTAYSELKLKIAEIAGSDSHHPDHVGSSYTWVKMEKPNLEALKLALHDGEDAIIHSIDSNGNPNDIKKRYYIKSLVISNASKVGRGQSPLKLNFSPWLSTIIGGRGSGKSSMLEFLRIALKKETELPDPLKQQFEEFNKVVETRGSTGMLLNDTVIRIELLKDGREIALEWKSNIVTEYEKNIFGSWDNLGVSSDLSHRFPLRIYSQKQLYEMTKNPNLLLQMIDNQLDKSIWMKRKNELENSWLYLRRNMRDLKSKLDHKRVLELNLKDTEAKLKLFEDMGHQDVLKNYQNVTTIDNFLKTLKEQSKTLYESLKRYNTPFDNIGIPAEIAEILDENSKVQINRKIEEFNEIIQNLKELEHKLEIYHLSLNETLLTLPWVKNKVPILEKMDEFNKKLLESGETNPDGYGQLLNRKQDLIKEIKSMKKVQEEFSIQKENMLKIYAEILENEKTLRRLRKEVISDWNRKNEDLRIVLSEMGDSFLAENSFRRIIRKEGTTFAGDVCERKDNEDLKRGFIYDLYNSDPNIWESRKKAIKNLSSENNFTKKFKDHIENLVTDTPEDIDKLLIWFPEDLVTLNLKLNGKEESIDVGSAGQRTAAMLSLLLSLDDTPLIIDQPEDDLDTRRITDLIVKGLRKLKNKQQIIVITHNPNIPVNGSAEMIIHMNFARGMIQVKSAGALQEKEVRKGVCEVMEGGIEALNNRYYRIYKALE